MAECHAKKAREKIAEKKAEGNVEKLEKLVDQLKGKIDSKDTVIKSEVKSAKIIEISIQILFTFIQRPASTGSKRRSRNFSGSQDSIKEVGIQHKTNPPNDSDSESIEMTPLVTDKFKK